MNEQMLSLEQWELLLVDNASDDPLADRFDISWHPAGRHVLESGLGLTPARLRGISEAKAEVIVFVDDDNELTPDYLDHVLEIDRDWPILGSWGGQVVPEFEISPPEWTRQYWKALALREVSQDCWSNIPGAAASEPFGSGLCVRRRVAARYAQVLQDDVRRRALDRKGRALVSGGDSDIAWCGCDLGLGSGVFKRLKLKHLIPASRLDEGYLLRLIEGLSYSKVLLDSIHGQMPMRPSRSQRLFDFYRHLHLSARDRRFLAAKERGQRAALAELETHKN